MASAVLNRKFEAPNLKSKKVLVVGFRRSGVAVAIFLADHGAVVTVTDSSASSSFPDEIAMLKSRKVKLALGGHDPDDFTGADLIVVSPGVPLYIPEIKQALKSGVETISELELAFRYTSVAVLAITGTNGKTTTTTLLGNMLKESGMKVFVGGNIGNPFIDLARKGGGKKADAAVVEVSSFQLEAAPTFKPDVAALINVSPDHLDRYKSFEDYRDAKANIFRNQDKKDIAVVNADCEASKPVAKNLKARKITVSQNARPRTKMRAWAGDGSVTVELGKERKATISTRGSMLTGVHNTENILMAASSAFAFGVRPKAIEKAVKEFKPLKHRMEFVGEKGKVRYFNDSKATNIDAVDKSLQSLNSMTVLLMGGYDKGGDFTPLEPLIRERARHTVLFGKAAESIAKQMSKDLPFSMAKGLKDALNCARKIAQPGDSVLLAPGCASFDEFKNYEERGEMFTQWVKELKL